MSTTDGFEAAVQGIRQAGANDALLAWAFTEGEVGSMMVMDAFSISNSGSGLASIPLGVVLTPAVFGQLGSTSATTLSIGGSDVEVLRLDLGGSGLASIPLGFQGLSILALPANGWGGGSGLASIPLGFTAEDASAAARS